MKARQGHHGDPGRSRRLPAGRRGLLLLLAFIVLPLCSALAHIGSPDVYYEGNAGPYHLLVTIRPPAVVPGVAQILVRSDGGEIDRIQILPLTIEGSGASLAPRPDTMRQSPDDPRLYTGNLWIMLRGSWKVQVQVEGRHGQGEVGVPVAAVSLTAPHMNRGMSLFLSAFGLVLVAGLIGIIRAANGPAQVLPTQDMSPALQRRSWIGMCFGLFFVILILAGGNMWWGWEAQASDRMVYRVPRLQAVLRENSLNVRLENPNSDSFTGSAWRNFWAQTVDSNDLVPDHGHIMHLFLVRMPDMKSFWHLHPEPTGSTSEFSAKLPALPPGRYRVYADIVHGTGFPETQVGQIDINDVAGQALGGDDSGGPDLAASDKTVKLPDGDRMVWERAAAPLRSREAVVFRFRVEDKDGKPATDLENYMGMAGHAVFMSDDGTVFAHVHPEGSVSMAALALAQGSRGPAGPAGSTGSTNAGSMNMDAMNMDAMNMGAMNMGAMKTPSPPAEVSFPYGFPQAGNYHVFVQIKRAGHVDTGVFTAHVEM